MLVSNKIKLSSYFQLENGDFLPNLELVFHSSSGKINGKKVVWICHALTANSNVSDWWKDIFGNNSFFNNEEYFVICVNVLGSCYGSTGPLSYNKNGKKYYHNFPLITVRDIVNSFEMLRTYLKIDKIDVLIGASLGGQQALEWSYLLKDKIDKLFLIATNAKHSAFGIAWNETQRMALLSDSSYFCEYDNAGNFGLRTARAIAMLSYRSYNSYKFSQVENSNDIIENFKVSSYQRYQGIKLSNRFSAHSYFVLSKAMDSHNLGRNRKSIEYALSKICADTTIIGINSDILFPVEEQIYLHKHIKNSKIHIIDSDFGHDGFLIESNKIKKILIEELEKKLVY